MAEEEEEKEEDDFSESDNKLSKNKQKNTGSLILFCCSFACSVINNVCDVKINHCFALVSFSIQHKGA